MPIFADTETKPSISFFLESPVTIRVGSGVTQRDFFVPKELLIKHSPFFKGALRGDWKESTSKVIELPEDDADGFHVYCCWLYGFSPFQNMAWSDSREHEMSAVDKDFCRLYDLWSFGMKILDRDFCDMVMDKILYFGTSTGSWPVNQMMLIYKRCSEHDPPRLLLCDIFTRISSEKWYTSPYMASDAEIWNAIAVALFRAKRAVQPADDRPWIWNQCRYHWHTKDGSKCYKTKYAGQKEF